MNNESIWDCLIIGAGPSGSCAAIMAARAGLKVILVEKSDLKRDKVCGGCLNNQAVKILADIGALEYLKTLTRQTFNRFHLTINKKRFDFHLHGKGFAVSRRQLDQHLAQLAKDSSVNIMLSCTAIVGPPRDGIRSAEILNKNEKLTVKTRCVILATGLSSGRIFLEDTEHIQYGQTVSPNSRLGLGARLPPGTITTKSGEIKMFVHSHGYVGITCLEDGSIDVAAAVTSSFLRKFKSPSDALASLLYQERIIKNLEAWNVGPWQGTPLLTRKREITHSNVVSIGDASSYIEPFTGEGIGWALQAGWSLGVALPDLLKNSNSESFYNWQVKRNAEFNRKSRTCKFISTAVRYPRTLSGILSAVLLVPGFSKYFVELIQHGILPEYS